MFFIVVGLLVQDFFFQCAIIFFYLVNIAELDLENRYGATSSNLECFIKLVLHCAELLTLAFLTLTFGKNAFIEILNLSVFPNIINCREI